MKTLLILLCVCSFVFSAPWKQVKHPRLKYIPDVFADVEFVEEFEGLPDGIGFRHNAICTLDPTMKGNWAFLVKGAVLVYFHGHSIKVTDDGAPIMNLSFKHGVKTLHTPKDPIGQGKAWPCYFFMCYDEDDDKDPVVVRLLFCPSRWFGRAYFTMYRANDTKDYMSFRIE